MLKRRSRGLLRYPRADRKDMAHLNAVGRDCFRGSFGRGAGCPISSTLLRRQF
jgi:hypothetical protein